MAKIATLRTRIRARVCAHLTLRYKNPKDFYTGTRRVPVTSREEAEG